MVKSSSKLNSLSIGAVIELLNCPVTVLMALIKNGPRVFCMLLGQHLTSSMGKTHGKTLKSP